MVFVALDKGFVQRNESLSILTIDGEPGSCVQMHIY